MLNKSPIFPMPDPQHFSNYGFNPQIDYFQKILEEARKHKRDSFRFVDALHFKLQKPILKEDSKKRKWWRNALLFWKWKWTDDARPNDSQDGVYHRNRVFRR
uniref:Uncharacterized protein n=1 Tax=Nelumbo nucifera TaxID=4432 RepID=A0A822ZG13_NELNU|nr:TPA_asm: hypothetical protein HUJ06_000871 [Nelumbo nucifera]